MKDPFRAAARCPPAARVLARPRPARGRRPRRRRARAGPGEARANPRYRWLGELPRARALRLLARCRLLILTSRLEGGANVLSEALACGVPVLSSRIAGSVGLLGAGYPGFFAVGDTDGLAALLWRAETDARFYRRLASRCLSAARLLDPVAEARSWRRLLRELEPA